MRDIQDFLQTGHISIIPENNTEALQWRYIANRPASIISFLLENEIFILLKSSSKKTSTN
jgi:hypothetical protein